MPLRRTLAVVVALSASAGAAPAAHALDAEGLRTALAERAPGLGVASGVRVVDLADGRTLFDRNPDRRRIPASNEKLFATAAALLRLGPQTTFTTSVRSPAASVVDTVTGRLSGDLYLVGGGDPALGDTGLRALARDVAAAGLTEVTGGVRGDESLFDSRRGGPRTGFRPDRDMGGWISALAWGHGRAGRTVASQPLVAAERLQRFLEESGVTFGKKARVGTLDGEDDTVLAEHASLSVERLIGLTNTNSDNLYAETLTKHLGAQFGAAGSTTAGLSVVRSTLGGLGIRPRLADGSGLSRANRTTPRQVVRLLERMAGQEVGETWLSSMAVMGRTGTLFHRLRGTSAAANCFGKSGTINSVSALSGYCRRPDGGLTAFSMLANGVSTFTAKKVEDSMVRVIAQYRGASRLASSPRGRTSRGG